MPPVSVWYSQHSTPNQRVVLPETLKIIDSNKFDEIVRTACDVEPAHHAADRGNGPVIVIVIMIVIAAVDKYMSIVAQCL